MTNKTDFATTPKYVLRSENQPFSSTLNSGDSKTSCNCVYGFSEKSIFDTFNKNTEQTLVPYPLVIGYLVNQIAEAKSAGKTGVDIGLMILDATAPTQATVSTATLVSILAAQEAKEKEVAIESKLVFDSKTGGYLKHDSKRTPPVATT